ncbi:MAG: DNA-binding response regulator [Actinomyces sp.]|nr:MAG: DNA-binding response regulator [Actinomyces sp.]
MAEPSSRADTASFPEGRSPAARSSEGRSPEGRSPAARGLARPAGPARRVLVVDDEPMVREVATAYLEREGFVVSEAADGAAALDQVAANPPDLVVLDVMLPEIDGFSVLTRIRRTSDVPVVLLTARAEEPDRLLGLELGADDYVVKPFSPRELAARVRTVLRRSLGPARSGGCLRFGGEGDPGLEIDGVSREVRVDGCPVELTPKEFDLLAFLARSPRQVFSRAQLLEQVWESSPDWQDPSTVTVHVRRIRQKIETDPESPRWIHTVWGVGYRFEP